MISDKMTLKLNGVLCEIDQMITLSELIDKHIGNSDECLVTVNGHPVHKKQIAGYSLSANDEILLVHLPSGG